MWGKAIAYIFIGLLELFSGLEIAFIDILAGLWFFIMGIGFIVASSIYRHMEWDHVMTIVN